jgi:hypothetical protein
MPFKKRGRGGRGGHTHACLNFFLTQIPHTHTHTHTHMEDWFRSIKKDISFVLSWISVRSELSLSPFDSALSASPNSKMEQQWL